ncbi:MAG: CopG family transcriptional regulator [Deltaproteobacteria bacterium]|nr:CopG family transcriptional regulator [Deltaproteobacteria bacterium]
MAKTVTIRMDDEAYETLSKHAEQDHRPLGQYIELAALKHAAQEAFCDDDEMNTILADDDLLKRIRRGLSDAKAHRGKFV